MIFTVLHGRIRNGTVMNYLRYFILHALSEKSGVYLPESIIDNGLSFEDPVLIASEILKKLSLKRSIDAVKVVDEIAQQVYFMEKKGVKILHRVHPDWPRDLDQLPETPHLLYILGKLSGYRKIAMIGSRNPPKQCVLAAHSLAKSLARCGFDIVSGGAIGCDIASHLSLINDGQAANAVLVLPGGLGNPYPRQNLRAFDRILDQGGCWVSERPYFHKPCPRDFIIRNRIIVGLSLGILVIHGDERSGTSTTVRLGLNQGKEIFVSSVGIDDSPLGKRLVAEGAEIVQLQT